MSDLIINKLKTCNCGCKGQDPWHKKRYRRKVRVLTETSGYVRLPFSTQPVPVKREVFETSKGKAHGIWEVDREKVIYDKF